MNAQNLNLSVNVFLPAIYLLFLATSSESWGTAMLQWHLQMAALDPSSSTDWLERASFLFWHILSRLTHSEAFQASIRHTTVYRAFSFFAVLCTFHERTGDHRCKFTVIHCSTLFPFSVNPGCKVCHLKAGELQSVMEPFCTANHSLFLKKTKRRKTPANSFFLPAVSHLYRPCDANAWAAAES